MDRVTKGNLILAFFAVFIGVVGVRLQEFILITLALLVSAFLVIQRSKSGVFPATITLLFLFPEASFGNLYGFDTHSPVIIAREVLNNGWPVSGIELSWGYVGTPLMHIHTAVASVLLNLPIVPTSGSKLLISAFLPIIYAASTFLFIFVLARRYTSTKVASIVPVLCWVAFYTWKVPFSRQALGIFFFVASVLCVHRLLDSPNRRNIVLFSLVTTSLILTHHLSSAIFGVYLGIVVLSGFITSRPDISARFRVPTILYVLIFILWFVLSGFQDEFVLIGASVLRGMTVSTSSIFPAWLTQHGISYSQTFSIKKIYAIWAYQIVLATPILAIALLQFRKRELNPRTTIALLFGGVIASLSVIASLTPTLDVPRLMTFFVVAAGWYAISAWGDVGDIVNYISAKQVVTVAVVSCIVLGAVMIPLFEVSSSQPNYYDGQKDEKLGDDALKMTSWVGSFVSEPIYGDALVQEIVIPFTQQPVESGFENLVQEQPEGTVVLAERNNYVYFGHYEGSTVIIDSSPVMNKTHTMSKPYTNGGYDIYQNTTPN
ncbi:hypothetical protein [Haloferax prahovense]|uniref:hypothetical protein n=1 Tax=Haloferax prahovense TaxID=381852 RepID=UPI001267D9F7|nr:hypothetical protein [Haloferax prahovense]